MRQDDRAHHDVVAHPRSPASSAGGAPFGPTPHFLGSARGANGSASDSPGGVATEPGSSASHHRQPRSRGDDEASLCSVFSETPSMAGLPEEQKAARKIEHYQKKLAAAIASSQQAQNSTYKAGSGHETPLLDMSSTGEVSLDNIE